MSLVIRWITATLLLWTASLVAQVALPPQVERLRTPQITTRPAERVLVVEVHGDPGVVGAAAVGFLFQLYYQMPQTAKGPDQPALRARWPVPLTRPRTEWIGLYALPVPEGVTAFPADPAPEGLRVSVTTWEYGTVVESVHLGPYDQEAPALQRLQEFARASGYVVSGGHEEEYIRGPTMTGPGDPAQYVTVLRYRVIKRPDAPAAEAQSR